MLSDYVVITAFEIGWSNLSNGDLLREAESEFDVLVTTDKNLEYQQNLKGRKLALVVLSTTSWPKIQPHQDKVAAAIKDIKPGDYLTIDV